MDKLQAHEIRMFSFYLNDIYIQVSFSCCIQFFKKLAFNVYKEQN